LLYFYFILQKLQKIQCFKVGWDFLAHFLVISYCDQLVHGSSVNKRKINAELELLRLEPVSLVLGRAD